MRIREAAVAGLFYPKRPAELQADVQKYLQGGRRDFATELQLQALKLSGVKAIVGPHAGYMYSGPVAGSMYAPLKAHAQTITRVLMFSPAHRIHVNGVAAPSTHGFRTPLGIVQIDTAAIEDVLKMPGVELNDEAHAPEHGIETHLPFLQELLSHRTSDTPESQPRWTLIPLLVGDAEPDAIVPILERFWGGPETLIVISSDLSHFLDYDSATKMDRDTANGILALAPETLGENSACGRIPLKALLSLAKQKNLNPAMLDLRNSGDTSGSRDRVVGYGAFVLS